MGETALRESREDTPISLQDLLRSYGVSDVPAELDASGLTNDPHVFDAWVSSLDTLQFPDIEFHAIYTTLEEIQNPYPQNFVAVLEGKEIPIPSTLVTRWRHKDMPTGSVRAYVTRDHDIVTVRALVFDGEQPHYMSERSVLRRGRQIPGSLVGVPGGRRILVNGVAHTRAHRTGQFNPEEDIIALPHQDYTSLSLLRQRQHPTDGKAHKGIVAIHGVMRAHDFRKKRFYVHNGNEVYHVNLEGDLLRQYPIWRTDPNIDRSMPLTVFGTLDDYSLAGTAMETFGPHNRRFYGPLMLEETGRPNTMIKTK